MHYFKMLISVHQTENRFQHWVYGMQRNEPPSWLRHFAPSQLGIFRYFTSDVSCRLPVYPEGTWQMHIEDSFNYFDWMWRLQILMLGLIKKSNFCLQVPVFYYVIANNCWSLTRNKAFVSVKIGKPGLAFKCCQFYFRLFTLRRMWSLSVFFQQVKGNFLLFCYILLYSICVVFSVVICGKTKAVTAW